MRLVWCLNELITVIAIFAPVAQLLNSFAKLDEDFHEEFLLYYSLQ
jgi:hypothetical protein